MSIICYLIRTDDNIINHYIHHSDAVDKYINDNFMEVDVNEFVNLEGNKLGYYSQVFCINNAWASMQYGINPKYAENSSELLSRAIIKSHRFEKYEMNASYLFSNEVKAIWEQLKNIPISQILSNLDNRDLYIEEDPEDVFWTKVHATGNYSSLLQAYFIAQHKSNGLLFYYC